MKLEVVLVFVLGILFLSTGVLGIEPFGANYSGAVSERWAGDAPESIPAQAGNVTELNIYGGSLTQSWQGYFGNVSGSVMLADGGDNVMYNWSAASPKGEIYASTNDSVNWGTIQCFNFSAAGTYADDSANAGNTSQYGMNLTQVEALFGIGVGDVDGVDETFVLSGLGTHDSFYTNNLEFTEGECMNTRVFSSAGTGEIDKFEEVLMYDSLSRSVVFTSILEQDVGGFDGKTHDFEIMVLEDGHGTDTLTTPYYFYVELQ